MRSSLLKTLLILGLFFSQTAVGQDAKELFTTAGSFIRSGDYSNAILVLNQALQLDPDNYEYKKQLGFAFYLKGDMNRAKNIIEPLLSNKEADVQVYQMAGNIYQARQEWKTAQKLYDRGIRKFPKSGELYNDNGLLLLNFKMFDASLVNWNKGIEKDPNFPGNYYNAARTYYYSTDPVWCIIYGEIFVNLESYTTRTAEVRDMLIESYKKLFNDPEIFNSIMPDDDKKSRKKSSDFVAAFKQSIGKQIGVVTGGIDPETLIMLRTRFLLDWYTTHAEKFPFALFDFQRKLLREGMFESYNQWIFGPVANQAAYRSWTTLHKPEYDKFTQFQRDYTFKLRPDEYYNDGKFTLLK